MRRLLAPFLSRGYSLGMEPHEATSTATNVPAIVTLPGAHMMAMPWPAGRGGRA